MLRVIFALFLVAGVSVPAWAQEISYTKHIKAVFDAKCAACHGVSSAPEYDAFKAEKDKWLAKGQGMRMDTYSHLIFYTAWPDTGSLMRRLDDGKNTSDGKPGNMYQYLGATEKERQKNLNLFKQWVGKDAWKLKHWKARGNVPAISKEDLDKIEVKY